MREQWERKTGPTYEMNTRVDLMKRQLEEETSLVKSSTSTNQSIGIGDEY